MKGRGGLCVGGATKREQWNCTSATNMGEGNKLRQTNQRIRGVDVGILTCGQPDLSYALHMHDWTKLWQNLQNVEINGIEGSMVSVGDVEEGRHGVREMS